MLVMVAFSACNHITMLSPFIFSIFVGEIVFVMLVPHSAILLLFQIPAPSPIMMLVPSLELIVIFIPLLPIGSTFLGIVAVFYLQNNMTSIHWIHHLRYLYSC